MEVRLSELIGGGFFESHRRIKAGAGELVEAGGRGSGKSSYLSVELILQLLKHPGCHAVVMRKVAATLRTSVYAQILWAIGQMGLSPWFRCGISPMECEYLPTGQKILFFGMDDAGKLKSVKAPFGYIGISWFEELDQFTAQEVRWAEQSLFRGGDFSLCLKSFNPPADPGHWVNLFFLEPKKGRFCHRSTYLELPGSWLGRRFLEDAEHLKKVNPTLYRHEYLGESVGNGEKVFQNLQFMTVSTIFDTYVSGVDWGWWPDPWAFNRVHYDARGRVLYIVDEATAHRMPNRDTAALVAAKVAPGEPVIADSSEMKSVADYRAAGLACRGAKKGPGSVAYSLKWLQSLEAIVIDPEKCPDTAREFAACNYVDGQVPDRDNHHIDAVRYATEGLWRRGN